MSPEFVPDARYASNFFIIGLVIKKADVLADRAGKQDVILHNAANAIALMLETCLRNIHAADGDGACFRGQEPQNNFRQRRFPLT